MNSKASKRPKNTQPNRSVYVIGFDWFLRAGPPDWHTKTSWCFLCPALRLKPPGKNQPAGPAPAGLSPWCHGFCQRENKIITRITLHSTTSAKTPRPLCVRYGARRSTATLKQRHIPPNVNSQSTRPK